MGYGGGVRPIKFFRAYIGSLSGPEISEYLDELKNNSKKIHEEIIKLMYNMPNLTWDEAWELTYPERVMIVSVLNDMRKE